MYSKKCRRNFENSSSHLRRRSFVERRNELFHVIEQLGTLLDDDDDFDDAKKEEKNARRSPRFVLVSASRPVR